ncbi:MAG: alpha/beta hydrolase [Deltaproteobacteria bacterium]|nr:MAG: alpha/beta hydrolase [Deltaproteobacteria bacterium]
MSNIFWSITILAAGMYGALCLYLFLMQAKLLYYPNIPSRKLTASPKDIGLEYESVSITASDGVTIHGWFVPAKEERGTVLFFHGNAGNISHRLDSLKIFHDLGLSSFIIDYRGYGRSQGSISEQGTYFDAESAWSYLTEKRNIPAQEIIVFGRSLGGAIAAFVASSKNPGALILESSFTSVPDMAARLYPIFPVRLLSRFQYNTKKMLQSVSSPVLIIHSPDDEIIPFENGQMLYESARAPKSMLTIHGGHNEGFLVSGSMYRDGIENFIEATLLGSTEIKNKDLVE